MKYAKTEAGQQAFKARSAPLSPRQRLAFILFDGEKTVSEVLSMTAGLGVTAVDVEHMVAAGLLVAAVKAQPAPAAAPSVADAPAPPAAAATSLPPEQRYARAWPIATQITADLGLRGFRLNLAVEAATGYEQLRDLLPKIREAVGAKKALPLEQALKE